MIDANSTAHDDWSKVVVYTVCCEPTQGEALSFIGVYRESEAVCICFQLDQGRPKMPCQCNSIRSHGATRHEGFLAVQTPILAVGHTLRDVYSMPFVD